MFDIMLRSVKTLFSTFQEIHAFEIGYCETLCPWPPQYHFDNPSDGLLQKEYHYYAAGRACGFITLLALIVLVKFILWR